jgi:hypothetical protein
MRRSSVLSSWPPMMMSDPAARPTVPCRPPFPFAPFPFAPFPFAPWSGRRARPLDLAVTASLR